MSSSLYNRTVFGFCGADFPRLSQIFPISIAKPEDGLLFLTLSELANSTYTPYRQFVQLREEDVDWAVAEEEIEFDRSEAFQFIKNWLELSQIIAAAQAGLLTVLGEWTFMGYGNDGWERPFSRNDKTQIFNRALPELFWNEGDLDQRYPNGAVFGIALGGYANPVLLDYNFRHGKMDVEISEGTPKRLEMVMHLQEILMQNHDPIWRLAAVHDVEVLI